MTLLKEGMWVIKKSWKCSGRVSERISRYVWLVNLVALSPDGLEQCSFITAHQVKKGKVEILK